MNGQQVRFGEWESSGFKVDITPSGTRISSEGEATSPALGGLRVDKVEMEFLEGQGYLTLTDA